MQSRVHRVRKKRHRLRIHGFIPWGGGVRPTNATLMATRFGRFRVLFTHMRACQHESAIIRAYCVFNMLADTVKNILYYHGQCPSLVLLLCASRARFFFNLHTPGRASTMSFYIFDLII